VTAAEAATRTVKAFQAAVVIRLQGGLGNQLFQYAFGRAMAIRSGVGLVLDTVSGFPRDPYRRSYALGPFAIECETLPESQASAAAGDRLRGRLSRSLSRVVPLRQRRYVCESDPARWDPAISDLRVQRRTYFDGFWQHEEYFHEIRNRLLQELTLRSPLADECRAVAERLSRPEAVAIHVRCLRHAKANSSVTPRLEIDPGYYERAMTLISERIANPRFFVFSDDPAWARQHIACGRQCEYLAGGRADYEDVWLMSRCRGLIIGNSTFSWWAAWLSRGSPAVVVAPQSGIGRGLRSVPAAWHLC
jgi:hypothetical protein